MKNVRLHNISIYTNFQQNRFKNECARMISAEKWSYMIFNDLLGDSSHTICISSLKYGTGTSCKKTIRKENFQNCIHSRWGRVSFLLELIKFEEEKRFGLQKQFCNYEK